MARSTGTKRRRRSSVSRNRKRPRSNDQSDSEDSNSTRNEDVQEPTASNASMANDPTEEKDAISKFNTRWKVGERTDQEVLEAQQDTWSSSVYTHFHDAQIIYEKGEVKYKFVCRTNSSAVVVRHRRDTSTGNLSRHVYACAGAVVPDHKSISAFAHGSSYTKPRFRYLIAKWIFRNHRPFSIIQDEELLQILRMLYAKVEVPSANTISRDVREIFALTRKQVGKILQDYSGRLHLCLDGWTSPNVYSFLGVTVHRVVEGNMKTFILDFIQLEKSHTGKYLATKLQECLTEFGIKDKLLAVVCDNASNNDTLISELELLDISVSSETRVRCFAHILNLVVKAILVQFSKSRSSKPDDSNGDLATENGDVSDTELDAEDEDEDDVQSEAGDEEDESDGEEYEVDPQREASDRRVVDEVAQVVQDDENFHASADEIRFGRNTVTKLRDLAKRVFHSPTLRNDLKTLCARAKIEFKVPIRPIATRWNSLTSAIERALELRPALDKLFVMEKWSSKKRNSLNHLRLSEEEWVLLEELDTVLQIFLDATLRVSRSNVPLLHEIIPVIDILTTALEDTAEDGTKLMVVRAAAKRGLVVLNKYYSKTDESIMHRCAMMLHPMYKMKYFHEQNWPAKWVQTAENILREQWRTKYKPTTSEELEQGAVPETLVQSSSSNRRLTSRFAVLDSYGRSGHQEDALEEHLRTPCLSDVDNPLHHYNAILTSSKSSEKRALARMAIDFLSAPASSTDIERAFSRGGLTVSKRRHSLSDESTRAATVLSSWAVVPGLIPEDEIVAVFRDKAKRAKGKEKVIEPENSSGNIEKTSPVITLE